MSVENGYVASQHFNAELAEARRQTELGWKAEFGYRDTQLELALADSHGHPLSGFEVEIELERPSTDRDDRRLTLVESRPGIYAAAGPLKSGQWDADVTIQRQCRPFDAPHLPFCRRRSELAPCSVVRCRTLKQRPADAVACRSRSIHLDYAMQAQGSSGSSSSYRDANCAACISGIERRARQIPGVVSARLNLTARRVRSTGGMATQEPQAFLDRLTALGYQARPFDPRETGFRQDDAGGHIVCCVHWRWRVLPLPMSCFFRSRFGPAPTRRRATSFIGSRH